MNLEEDYNIISEQMSNNFSRNTFFLLRDLKICDIVVDLHCSYNKLLDTEIIQIEFFNDNILDREGNNVSLLHFNVSQKNNKYSLKDFCKLSLENLLQYLQDIKFDLLLGRFVPKDQNHLRTAKIQFATKNLFKSIGIEVVDSSNECVVCYERTYCKTACNHYLCFSCCSNIRPSTPNNSDDEDEDDENIHCPICRSVVLYLYTGGCCGGR
jgi:hypothetical protein